MGQNKQGRRTASGSKVPKTCLKGLTPRPSFFLRAHYQPLTPTVMRRHREDIFHTTCTAYTTPDPRDPSIPLRSTRDDSFRCHVERSTFRCEVETSRPIGAFTFTNHIRNAQNAETNINDRSRCSIIPRLERGMPAVDGFVTYHSTFSSLDGGAFHPLRAILHTNGRHALILSAIPGGHAIFENSSTLYIGTSAEEELCARIECLASAGRSPFYHTFGEACPFRACRFNRAFP